jgi:hypothetical protein
VRNGRVVTFYSYKGGTGRTMALANVAWILAANGHRVLAVDWDLESPGLHRYFAPFIHRGALETHGGVIDLIQEFEWASTQDDPGRPEGWHEQFARVRRYAFPLEWAHFPGDGRLDVLFAGREHPDYTASLFGLRWDEFYERQSGGAFLDALRADMKAHYDYTLIDSRTGQSDVADICTGHLPDILVDCFTLNHQGIEGAVEVARRVQRYQKRPTRILPVAMRVDPADKERADVGRSAARQRFAGLPAELSEPERDAYWASNHVPYQAYYAYEETLAAFGDAPGSPVSLLAAYESLTGLITEGAVRSLPPMDPGVRARVSRRFARRLSLTEEEVVLRYAPQDQVWAEWIEHVLAGAGVRVDDTAGGRPIKVISAANADDEARLIPADRSRDPYAIYISDRIAVNRRIPPANSAVIAGLGADAAVDAILRLIGRPDVAVASGPAGPRFPGSEPAVFNVPARNARFTGREASLLELRERLRTGSGGTELVGLHGMGGIGKTQLALEYAYRFRTAYDVVWWVAADPLTFVDTSLIDLLARLSLPTYQTGPETLRVVLNALARGEPYPRWLLIFDNAEDERVGRVIPAGGGHVIITSRAASWGDRAQMMQLDVFPRRESIDHLIHRAPGIGIDEAGRVAEAVGDLPVAVAAAGAWLADTGTPVADYVREIELHGARALAVEQTWSASLDRLGERSPAAHRLLQLCSVLAPTIALGLVYSEQMAAPLLPFDRALSEPLARGALVQQIHRLALLRLEPSRAEPSADEEPRGGNLRVHRLLQHAVRSRMSAEELEATRHEVHQVLGALRPAGDVDDLETWPRFRMLWPHLETSGAATCESEAVRRLFIDRVRYLWLRGDLSRALDLAEATEARWSTMDTAAQLPMLRATRATLLRTLGRSAEAYTLDTEVLATQDFPHSLITAGGLGADLRALGRYREALDHDRATLDRWRESFGAQYPGTLAAQADLAASHRLAGEFARARELDEDAYERSRALYGEEHPRTLRFAGAVGRDLRDAGEYDRSAELLRAVSAILARVTRPGSRHLLNAQVNLAVSLRAAGQTRAAHPLLENAYARLTEAYGRSSPDTLTARHGWAVNLLAIGEFATAERELSIVHSLYEEHLGPLHPCTVATLSNLAVAAAAAGEVERALDLASSATTLLADAVGQQHPHALSAEANVAIFTALTGSPERGADQLADLAERTAAVVGEGHPIALRCLANLSLVRSDSAESAGERLARRLGTTHPAVVALRNREYLYRVLDPHPY